MTGEAVPALSERVRAAVRARWPDAEVVQLAPLHGGISSLTFSAVVTRPDRAERRVVVVKVAPPGLAPVRNRDVLRQARVMAALSDAAGVRVPAVLAQDPGTPPFFVMEHVPGESYEPAWDARPRPPAADVVRRRALAAARMLAALQSVAPADAGLGDEPVLSPTDELKRWVRLFATAGDDLRGDEAALASALRAGVPEARLPGGRACILHGDYRLGNLQCAGDAVAAIIDWEIWSVGDPRHDLAWLMLFADPVMERDAVDPAAAAAMPSAEALLGEYVAAAGLPAAPPYLTWFRALAHYKLGATMAVLAKRNRRLAEPDPGLERAARTTPATLARGLELLSG